MNTKRQQPKKEQAGKRDSIKLRRTNDFHPQGECISAHFVDSVLSEIRFSGFSVFAFVAYAFVVSFFNLSKERDRDLSGVVF